MANLLHQGATVQCVHGGQAQPSMPDQHVTVGNQKAVTQSAPYTVSGCSNPVQSGGPCVTATFTSAATRVFANKQPLLLNTSQAVCSPTGSLIIVSTQTRANGT